MNFHLDYLPERPVKPRNSGLNMIMDKGLSVGQAEAHLESCGHLVDIVKLGFGTSYMSRNLKEKIKLYKDNDIKVYLGGTLFEAFYVRNKVDEYKKVVDDLGLELVEISDGSVQIPNDLKCEIIRDFAKSYQVMSEVGSKEEGILISPAKWIKMMQTELEAGSWKVIAEARESGTVGIYRPNGTAHTMLINKILAKVAKDDILWEAPIKAQQVWFIKHLGANVNLGNLSFSETIPLECLRLGLRGDTFFSFLPEDVTAQFKS